MGRCADVHASVVENQIFEVDQLAFQPQTGARVSIMCARNPAVADRALGQAFVEPGKRVLRDGERLGELSPRQWIGDSVTVLQGLDNLNKNRSNGSYHGNNFRHNDRLIPRTNTAYRVSRPLKRISDPRAAAR